jgi:NAD(P)-dependent dehydrogenase (short-subunit alcohol dehydrogenase family)
LNGSVHAVLGIPGWSAYAAAKGGVRTMTRNLASELAPRGIRVNQVTPGGTKTPLWSPLAPTDDAMKALEVSTEVRVPESGSRGLARSYDYVMVGAGSAGCVVARRLVVAGKPR